MRVMPKAIIIEGPRGVGKTTITKHLINIFDKQGLVGVSQKFPRGDFPTKDMLSTIEFISSVEQDTFTYIIDRFHLSELVLRSADKAKPRAEVIADTEKIAMTLGQHGMYTFLLHCDEGERRGRIIKRNDGRIDVSPLARVYWQKLTKQIISIWPLTYTFDVTAVNAQTAAEIIFGTLYKRLEEERNE